MNSVSNQSFTGAFIISRTNQAEKIVASAKKTFPSLDIIDQPDAIKIQFHTKKENHTGTEETIALRLKTERLTQKKLIQQLRNWNIDHIYINDNKLYSGDLKRLSIKA